MPDAASPLTDFAWYPRASCVGPWLTQNSCRDASGVGSRTDQRRRPRTWINKLTGSRRQSARRPLEQRIDRAREASELSNQGDWRRLALARVHVPKHGELRVANPAASGERVPQASRLAHGNHRVVAIV